MNDSLVLAVGLCALLNFAGAFLSIKVAATISNGIVDSGVLDLRTIFAALVGAAPAWRPAGQTRSRAPRWWRR